MAAQPPSDPPRAHDWCKANAARFAPAKRYQAGLCVTDDPLGPVFAPLPKTPNQLIRKLKPTESKTMMCPSNYTLYPWMQYAMEAYGVRSIPGPGTNVHIAEYLGTVGLSTAGDETAWCSAFANWCVQKAGLEGTGLANARSWLNWHEANACLAYPFWGCVTILWRESRESWKGHVGFCVGQSGDNVYLLGGNQGSAVSTAAFPKSRVLGYRWPARFHLTSPL